MAVRVSYHCPHCASDINAQYWLPTVTYRHPCRVCGNIIERSPESIRASWSNTIPWLGFLPLWAALCVMPGLEKERVGSRIFLAFLITLLFGIVALSVFGWVIGLFVSILARRRPGK